MELSMVERNYWSRKIICVWKTVVGEKEVGDTAVASVVWRLGWGVSSVAYLLWPLCCGVSVVACLLWRICCGACGVGYVVRLNCVGLYCVGRVTTWSSLVVPALSSAQTELGA